MVLKESTESKKLLKNPFAKIHETHWRAEGTCRTRSGRG